MTWFIFLGDMLVMAFMIVLVMLVSLSPVNAALEDDGRIPLEDEHTDG